MIGWKCNLEGLDVVDWEECGDPGGRWDDGGHEYCRRNPAMAFFVRLFSGAIAVTCWYKTYDVGPGEES